MQQDAAPTGDLGDLGDRLQGAGLVVGVHHGDEHRVGGGGGQDGGVLGDLGDDVRAAVDRGGAGKDRAADGQGVSLGAAGGEDDLGRSGPDERGDLGAGPGEQPAGSPGVGVGAGEVAKSVVSAACIATRTCGSTGVVAL